MGILSSLVLPTAHEKNKRAPKPLPKGRRGERGMPPVPHEFEARGAHPAPLLPSLNPPTARTIGTSIAKTAWGFFHGAQGLEPGGTHVTVNKATKIALHLYKHPAIGGKKTKVVPFLTNVAWDIPAEEHRSKAYIVPPIVRAYRALSSGVDTCNQMALQLRELGRFRTWSKAGRAFILRYAMSNTFATCQVLHLLPPNTTMFQFKWNVMKERCHLESPSDLCTPSPSVAHLIVCTDTALMCQGCSKGRPKTRCSACGVHLHVKCFAPYHMR